MPSGLLRFFATLWVASFLIWHSAWAEDTELTQVQAAYVFNFIKFTTWPAVTPENKPLRIRILQNPAMAKAMTDSPEQSIHNRPLEIRNCNTAVELVDADLVFIPAKAASSLSQETWDSFGPTTMVVSDWENVLSKGGTAQLLTMGGKVRFAFNLKRSKGLNVSSKLLRLATEVTE